MKLECNRQYGMPRMHGIAPPCVAGHFKLAGVVQYVPLSTVGGYLGYVGYFCLAAGLGLACNIEVPPSLLPLDAVEGGRGGGHAMLILAFQRSVDTNVT